MRILVTGADGFIGSHLARSLAQSGHDVSCSVYQREAGAGEVRVDLAQPAELERLPRGVDAVVHAAGAVDARLPLRTMVRANVDATANLTVWAKRQRVRHFVHLSSVSVYGPLTLGERRSEQTPRLGRTLGLPYMRTKARAEVLVEQSGVPYTLLRPPAVLGPGDSVVSAGFVQALCEGGLPMLPGADPQRMVSLVSVEGLAEIVAAVLEHGPLGAPLHTVDFELTFGELAAAYERALGQTFALAATSWATAVQTRNEVGLAWLLVSARFGQHYLRERLVSELGYRPRQSLDYAIQSGLSGLQPPSGGLF